MEEQLKACEKEAAFLVEAAQFPQEAPEQPESDDAFIPTHPWQASLTLVLIPQSPCPSPQRW